MPFFYDLLSGHLSFRVTPEDDPQQWGAVLLRMLPSKDFLKDSQSILMLRVLEANPGPARAAPMLSAGIKTEEERMAEGRLDRAKVRVRQIWALICKRGPRFAIVAQSRAACVRFVLRRFVG